jgi:lipopolysaccharide export system protein LptA
MRYKIVFGLLVTSILGANELQIKANSFNADENTGLSVFSGNVNIKKQNDELNASTVSVYTNKNNEPIKYVAVGNVSFVIQTKQASIYRGEAGKVIYMPETKEYHFFKNVHLRQVDQKKEIIGDEVVLKTVEGKAYAKGVKSEPVIMIFNISDENSTKE